MQHQRTQRSSRDLLLRSSRAALCELAAEKRRRAHSCLHSTARCRVRRDFRARAPYAPSLRMATTPCCPGTHASSAPAGGSRIQPPGNRASHCVFRETPVRSGKEAMSGICRFAARGKRIVCDPLTRQVSSAWLLVTFESALSSANRLSMWSNVEAADAPVPYFSPWCGGRSKPVASRPKPPCRAKMRRYRSRGRSVFSRRRLPRQAETVRVASHVEAEPSLDQEDLAAPITSASRRQAPLAAASGIHLGGVDDGYGAASRLRSAAKGHFVAGGGRGAPPGPTCRRQGTNLFAALGSWHRSQSRIIRALQCSSEDCLVGGDGPS